MVRLSKKSIRASNRDSCRTVPFRQYSGSPLALDQTSRATPCELLVWSLGSDPSRQSVQMLAFGTDFPQRICDECFRMFRRHVFIEHITYPQIPLFSRSGWLSKYSTEVFDERLDRQYATAFWGLPVTIRNTGDSGAGILVKPFYNILMNEELDQIIVDAANERLF